MFEKFNFIQKKTFTQFIEFENTKKNKKIIIAFEHGLHKAA